MKRKSLWSRIDRRLKVIAGIAASILALTGIGWTAAFTFPTMDYVHQIEEKVEVAGGKADYLLTQQIDSVREKQKRLRSDYRKASSSEKKAIELDLQYWRGEQDRLESIQKGK